MRSSRLAVLLLPLLSMACASPARLVATNDDRLVSVSTAADDLAKADVIALGELHDSGPVHRLHQQLLAALYERRPNLVIAMEMFERDVQSQVLLYLNGLIDEDEFRGTSRPWPNYVPDYRPVIEFARQHGLPVLAANAPRPLARKVSQEGIAAVKGDPNVAKATTAPEDDYYDAFVSVMKGHAGADGDDALRRMYAAQCLKDDTMAETIVEYLGRPGDFLKVPGPNDQPLVVLFCGRMHSDFGRGTVARIRSRKPGIDVRVLSAEVVADLSAGRYQSPRAVADYVVVTEGRPDDDESVLAKPVAAPVASPTHPAKSPTLSPQHPAVSGSAAGAPPAASSAASGAGSESGDAPRPALGLMPDYGYQVGDGIRVESVREGGPAAAAGIEAGDVIRAIGGEQVADMQSYAEVLGMQAVGKTVTVRVRREGAEVDLQVKVGQRGR